MMVDIRVPEVCMGLLAMARTHYKGGPDQVARQYADELRDCIEYLQPVLQRLPTGRAPRILDIGCGLAGISAAIALELGRDCELTLADCDGFVSGESTGYRDDALECATYCSFEHTRIMLWFNGLPPQDVRFVDLLREPLPDLAGFDLVLSQLSWGFHYPIDTYRGAAAMMVADCRRGTPARAQLEARGEVSVLRSTEKYETLLCSTIS